MHVLPLSHRQGWILAALLVTALATGAQAQEKLPPGAKVVKVEAQPAAVTLKHRFDYAQLLLTAQLESGERIDVTRMAQVAAPANLVAVSPVGLVRPTADGAGELKYTVAGQTITVPVKVSGQKEAAPV